MTGLNKDKNKDKNKECCLLQEKAYGLDAQKGELC